MHKEPLLSGFPVKSRSLVTDTYKIIVRDAISGNIISLTIKLRDYPDCFYSYIEDYVPRASEYRLFTVNDLNGMILTPHELNGMTLTPHKIYNTVVPVLVGVAIKDDRHTPVIGLAYYDGVKWDYTDLEYKKLDQQYSIDYPRLNLTAMRFFGKDILIAYDVEQGSLTGREFSICEDGTPVVKAASFTVFDSYDKMRKAFAEKQKPDDEPSLKQSASAHFLEGGKLRHAVSHKGAVIELDVVVLSSNLEYLRVERYAEKLQFLHKAASAYSKKYPHSHVDDSVTFSLDDKGVIVIRSNPVNDDNERINLEHAEFLKAQIEEIVCAYNLPKEKAEDVRVRIVSAAVLYRPINSKSGENDLIIPSPRHHDVTSGKLLRYMYALGFAAPSYEPPVQGFIDNHGRFFNRTDAWKIASANNQIIKRVGGDETDGGTLYSENLY